MKIIAAQNETAQDALKQKEQFVVNYFWTYGTLIFIAFRHACRLPWNSFISSPPPVNVLLTIRILIRQL